MNLDIKEICILLGEKDLLIYQLQKQLAEALAKVPNVEPEKEKP